MKILCFYPALAPYRVDFFNLLGGLVDLRVMFLYKNVPSQAHRQEELLKDAKFGYDYLTKGVEFAGRAFRTGIFRRIREEKADVVFSYEAGPVTALIVLYRMIFGGKFRLFTTTDDRPAQIEERRGARRFVRDFVYRHVDGIIVTCEESGNAIRSVVGIGNEIETPVLPIIHDIDLIRSNAKDVILHGLEWRRSFAREGEKVLLFVGRLVPVKNLYWLVEKFASEMEASVRLVIVGGGPEESGLAAKVKELGLGGRVRFEGRLEGDALYAIMSAADALVLCSHSETYGAVVAEAMQWGTPALVRDTCGAKYIVEEDVNGCVFHGDDFAACARKVLLLKKGTDSILPLKLSDYVERMVARL